MPTQVTDPFGNSFAACSISTAVKAKFGKDAFKSEAEWAMHVKKDAYNVLRQKIMNGEVLKNTVVGRTPLGHKLVYKGEIHGDHVFELSKTGVNERLLKSVEDYDQTLNFLNQDWDFGPNMATMAQAQRAIVDSPAKLEEWLDKHDNEIEIGDTVATVKPKDTGIEMQVKYQGFDFNNKSSFHINAEFGTEILDIDGLGYYAKSDLYEVKYKVGQELPNLPLVNGLPVASTSKSVGALTNEDAATLFVKTKDKLAAEKGINIKGANPTLDHLVYKTIADQAGYTPGEMIAKVEAYKASGKKLSALKKKVLPKSGNPTKAATEKAVNNATAAVKKEELKPEEVVQVWDDEAVAKAYIKAKDHVVATNDKGWTLYTKNPDFDKEIHKWMQADLGPIKPHTADTAIANYIATKQKLSVLKKQMIKKGELVPQADTLKGGKKAGAGAEEPVAKVAPKETGAGQVGKASEDPKKVDPKHELTDAQKQEAFELWENSNLPLSSSGEKLYSTAKQLANKYGLKDDVLPILRAVDELKTKKFGLAPSQNKNLYEKKVLEHLANPQPSGYIPPSHSSFSTAHIETKAFGELPEDSSLFEEISHFQMSDIFNSSMYRPNSVQQSAIRTYTGSTYHEINGHIREGGSVMTQRYARHIQESMSPLPKDIVVRRGTSLRALGVQSPEELVGSIGKVFREPAFSSTAVGGSGQFGGQVNLIIQAPKGTKAVWARPYSGIPGENELILSAGTRFQILKVEQKTSQYGGVTNVVHVRVVGAEVK